MPGQAVGLATAGGGCLPGTWAAAGAGAGPILGGPMAGGQGAVWVERSWAPPACAPPLSAQTAPSDAQRTWQEVTFPVSTWPCREEPPSPPGSGEGTPVQLATLSSISFTRVGCGGYEDVPKRLLWGTPLSSGG